eukprot:6376129-Prymnesium_polylepis.1
MKIALVVVGAAVRPVPPAARAPRPTIAPATLQRALPPRGAAPRVVVPRRQPHIASHCLSTARAAGTRTREHTRP